MLVSDCVWCCLGRNCGWLICGDCSPHKYLLPQAYGSSGPQRVCNNCYSNLQQVAQIRNQVNGMVMAQQQQLQERRPAQLLGISSTASDSFSSESGPPLLRFPSPTPIGGGGGHDGNAHITTHSAPPPSTQAIVATYAAPQSPTATVVSSSSSSSTTSSSAAALPPLPTKPQLLPLTIPEWTYLFKPFAGILGAEISVGRVGITVHHISDLPLSSSTTNPYVRIKLGKMSKQTHKLNLSNPQNVVNPSWAELTPQAVAQAEADGNGTNFLLFEVPNILEVAHVEVWDYSSLGSDVLLAHADIPLPSLVSPSHLCPALSNSNPRMLSYFHDTSFPLIVDATPESQNATKKALNLVGTLFNPLEWREMSAEKKKAKIEELKKKSEMEAKKGSSSSSSNRNGASSNASNLGPAKIRLEMAYSYSKLGDFFSHFTPPVTSGGQQHKHKRKRLTKQQGSKSNLAAEQQGEEHQGEEEEEEQDELDDEWESISHADAHSSSSDDEDNKNLAPFSLLIVYDLFRKSWLVFHPLYQLLQTVSTSLLYQSPTSPSLFLPFLLLFSLTFFLLDSPWLVLVALQLWVLRQLVWKALYRRVVGGKPNLLAEETRRVLIAQQQHQSNTQNAAGKSSSAIDSSSTRKRGGSNVLMQALQTVNPLNLVKGNKGNNNNSSSSSSSSSDSLHPDLLLLHRILLPHIVAFLRLLGFTSSETSGTGLARLQHAWAQGIEGVYMVVVEIANWQRHIWISRSLLLLSLLGLLLSCSLPQSYLFSVAATLVLIRHTSVGEKLAWIASSTGAAIQESTVYTKYQEYMQNKKQ